MKQELDKKQLVEIDEDYIEAPRYSNSLKIYLEKNDGKEAKTDMVAKMLLMTEEEVERTYQSALSKLRDLLT